MSRNGSQSMNHAPQQQELPPRDALLGIARSSDIEDRLRLRASHPELRAVASESISTLQAVDLGLPERAWLAFPSATGLRLELGDGTPGELLIEGDNLQRNLKPAGMQRCAQVLRCLPQRVQRLQLVDSCKGTASSLVIWPEMEPEVGMPLANKQKLKQLYQSSRSSCLQVATAVKRSPAAPQLKELAVDWEVLASCMDGMLHACTALESLRLCAVIWPWVEQPYWQPALPSSLTSLELHSGWQWLLKVDAAALAGLSRLQHLALHNTPLVEPKAEEDGAPRGGYQDPEWVGSKLSMDAVGRLTTLRSLSLMYASDYDATALSGGLTELAPLVQLTSLTLLAMWLQPEAWATLARLPLLARLEAEQKLAVPPLATAAPLAALTSLQAYDFNVPADAAPGSLCTTLPSLRQLEVKEAFGHSCYLAELLRGHPHLRSLKLQSSGLPGGGGTWPQQVLASLPQLQRFSLEGAVEGADVLVADLAACSSLRSIQIKNSHFPSMAEILEKYYKTPAGISGAGVRALAQAASSATLESIVLDTACAEEWGGGRRQPVYVEAGRVALADALPLLRARMPRLRELKVPVLKMADEELHAVARQLGRPAEVLRSQLALDVKGAQ